MNYAYIRVSTEKQTVENQKIVIKNYCKFHRITKVKWYSETISGTKNPEKRILGELIKTCNSGDTVVITELSRLGRSLTMIFNVLQEFLDKGVRVLSIKENYELGDNIQSKVIAFAFGLSAEIERELISERTKAGLERARKNGKHIGRKKGISPSKFKLSGKERYIKNQLLLGRSKRSIALELNVSWTTINSFIIRKKIVK